MEDEPIIPDAYEHLALLPLRDVVVYPQMVIPLFVGREKSIQALDYITGNDGKEILLVAQKKAEIDDPDIDELYEVGTIANILQLLKLPDGTVKVLVEGIKRVRLENLSDEAGFLMCDALVLEDGDEPGERENRVLKRSILSLCEQYIKLNPKIPDEVLNSLSGIDQASRLADTIAAHLPLKVDEKQRILEDLSVIQRLEHIMTMLETEIDLLQLEKRIRGRVKQQMEKSQREYYLNEQMKAIQKEISELDDVPSDLDELADRIEHAGMTHEAREKAEAELNKLRMMSPMSAEATVVRNYLDTLLSLPWRKRSRIRRDIGFAHEVLDAEHYGLDKIKERILEYLAVQQKVRRLNGPVLCLVGPPGVGKTSLGKSIARSVNRKFVRMALGGVHDEAEIRGHRRTYIGSMPGKILQNLTKAGTRNPLFLLDEVDKMAMDFRGDPASALLEVLDAEHNASFSDHYLEVDFDLSEVMFVCTANTLDIPAPLLDRMEVVRLSGYTEEEKTAIAQQYLLPKQCEKNGLDENAVHMSGEALQIMVRQYTREAGVRSLERQLAKICRKITYRSVTGTLKEEEVTVGSLDQVSDFLGPPQFRYGIAEEENRIGQVTGLAWTEVGGELLNIEAVVMPGKGKLSHTGTLGDVMQESIQAALTVVRSRAKSLAIADDFYQNFDLHVHIPEGAIPKDGPSAGAAVCTALVSALMNNPARADTAMTGEITLRGEVLPIGGLKEKLLAAHRAGIRLVLIPEDNIKDLVDIPLSVREEMEIRSVRWIDEILPLALEHGVTPAEVQSDILPATKKQKNEQGGGKVPRAH